MGIHGDSMKMHRDFGLQMQGTVCLSEMANARLVGAATSDGGGQAQPEAAVPFPQKWSLAGLVAALLRLRLEKSQALRCSDWEGPLTGEQRRYAATDAWASLRCWEVSGLGLQRTAAMLRHLP